MSPRLFRNDESCSCKLHILFDVCHTTSLGKACFQQQRLLRSLLLIWAVLEGFTAWGLCSRDGSKVGNGKPTCPSENAYLNFTAFKHVQFIPMPTSTKDESK